jgi:hypothetical protein
MSKNTNLTALFTEELSSGSTVFKDAIIRACENSIWEGEGDSKKDNRLVRYFKVLP